jgi:hypothetical protein
MQVDHSTEAEIASLNRYVGNVHGQYLILSQDLQVLQQIRKTFVMLSGSGCVGFGTKSLKPHKPIKAFYTLFIDY